MGFFDFFRKKKVNFDDIVYMEMEPSRARCDGIITRTTPNKSREYTKPKRMKFTGLALMFFKKNV